MSEITILKEMLKEDAIVKLEDYHDKKRVILKEPHPAAYEVTINGMPEEDEVIVIKSDCFKAPKDVFADSKNECKRADFIIIATTNGKKVIICIELKAGKGGTEKQIIQQLKGAKCFVEYCRSIGQEFWEENNFLQSYEYRFVSIRNISISKKPTRSLDSKSKHDRPEKMLKITSPKGIQFKQLIGKS